MGSLRRRFRTQRCSEIGGDGFEWYSSFGNLHYLVSRFEWNICFVYLARFRRSGPTSTSLLHSGSNQHVPPSNLQSNWIHVHIIRLILANEPTRHIAQCLELLPFLPFPGPFGKQPSDFPACFVFRLWFARLTLALSLPCFGRRGSGGRVTRNARSVLAAFGFRGPSAVQRAMKAVDFLSFRGVVSSPGG